MVNNKGSVPIKIVAVAMKVVFDNQAFPDQILTQDAQQRIVAPGQITEFPHLMLNVPLGSTAAKVEQLAQIHCSDLAGVSRHTFSVSDRSENINQSLGFQPI